MGISEVEGYGTINQNTAYEIYEDWYNGEVELSTSQQKYCESFLTDEEIEEIEYGDAEQTGEDSIDTEDTDKSSTASATGITVANMASVYTVTGLIPAIDGFSALVTSLLLLAYGVAQYGLTEAYDTAYKDRTDKQDNADDTNATMDSYSETLTESMDMMNDDMDAYSEATDTYTESVNENTSEMADLQVQLAAAETAGDTEGAAALREQMQALEEQGEDISTDEIEELQENIEDYQTFNTESIGAGSAGQSVADFLKQGTALGVGAAANGALNLAAGALIAATKSAVSPKIAPFFPDLPSAGVAKATLMSAAAAFVAAAGMWTAKSVNEFECGSAGGEMQSHVNALNDMIGEQSEYIDTTSESFEETDEESQESQDEATEAASDATATGIAAVTASASTNDDEDKDKTIV